MLLIGEDGDWSLEVYFYTKAEASRTPRTNVPALPAGDSLLSPAAITMVGPASSKYLLPQSHFIMSRFFSSGVASLCIDEEMHTACFYFIYSIKSGQRSYNDHTNRSHKEKVSKHHQTSKP
jgi:hypothetical protein